MIMKQKSKQTLGPKPSEDEVRDYAYHLYVQGGRAEGHEMDNWLEAEACLCACIPKDATHTRLHQHTQSQEKSPAASSTQMAAA